MSILNDSRHPMYVPEKNRKIARERAQKYVDMISDYLEVKETIPTGFNRYDRIKENKTRILKILGGNEKDWDNWRWQIGHLIRDTKTLGQILRLTPGEPFPYRF